MIVETPILLEIILPFSLVFILLFSILQRTKLLGEEVLNLDVLVSFAASLLLVLTPFVRDFIIGFVPWIAIGISVLFIFLILYGFAKGDFQSSNDGESIIFH